MSFVKESIRRAAICGIVGSVMFWIFYRHCNHGLGDYEIVKRIWPVGWIALVCTLVVVVPQIERENKDVR